METTVKKLVNEKHVQLLVLLCSISYMISYITRVNYSAVLVEIIESEGLAKTVASFPLTGLFITYGVGQLISGVLGDRFSPEKLVLSGLLITAGMNFLMPMTSSPVLMTVIWCVNGFAQALMWPPIVKILTTYITKEMYKKYIVFIGYGGSLGTIAVYLLSPLVIRLSGWKALFLVCALLAVIMALVWIRSVNAIEKKARDTIIVQTQEEVKYAVSHGPLPRTAVVLLIAIVIATALQGVLRDGISTWMPTYITDTFHLASTVSILTGVALPIFSMCVSGTASYINRRLITNEAACSAIYFGICVLTSFVLCMGTDASPALSVAMLAIANAVTHGINLMFTCMVIPSFEKFGKTSTITGIINSSTYVGSALSTYGIALITENFGWGGTMIAWCAISVLGVITCLGMKGRLQRFKA